MRGRSTLILLLVMVVLGVYVWRFEKDKPTEVEVEEQARVLIDVRPERVDKITIARDDGVLELWRDSDRVWQMLSPVEDRADANVVNSLLQLLSPLRSARRVPGDRGSVVTYRLDRPDVVATFRVPRSTGFESYELRVGRLNRAFDGHYAIVDQDTTRLGLLDRAFVESHLARDPMDFRFRRITDFKSEEVRRVIVAHRGEPRIVLERRFDSFWELIEPVTGLADQAAVNQLVRRMASQRVASFVAEEPTTLALFGLETPRLSVTTVLENQASTVLFLGNEDPDRETVEGPEIFAKRAALPKVFTIAGTSYDELAKTLFDLRNRSLYHFAISDVDSLIATEGGRTFRAIRRAGGVWVNGSGETLRTVVVEQALKNLVAMSALELDDTRVAVSRKGLDGPALDVSAHLTEGRVEAGSFVVRDGAWWGRAMPDGAVSRLDGQVLEQLRRFVTAPPVAP